MKEKEEREDSLQNLINEEKQKKGKIEEKEEKNEKDDDPLMLEIKLTNYQEEEKFNPEINYLSLNPFKTLFETGFGITTAGFGALLFSSSEIIILSGIFFSGIGASFLIPGLIGLGIYSYFKKN